MTGYVFKIFYPSLSKKSYEDLMWRANLAIAEEARQNDHIKINKVCRDLGKTNFNMDLNTSNIATQAAKLQLVDNVSNKNKDKISRLEERIKQLEQQ